MASGVIGTPVGDSPIRLIVALAISLTSARSLLCISCCSSRVFAAMAPAESSYALWITFFMYASAASFAAASPPHPSSQDPAPDGRDRRGSTEQDAGGALGPPPPPSPPCPASAPLCGGPPGPGAAHAGDAAVQVPRCACAASGSAF
eukprot:CAMPEP_0114118054 /NCGR_PEP_ID=MMETSP0043_2-20121206/5378_1 /TAXON_ID=464988 /ORGANISM="Hemiselmis andersenii, Strain CCMP644" /LENGTH=146 /DNA_ID=CAMNT_0001210519 /DNA_START=107 /DNA_END=548 /DNA_ORIENTATION=+